MDCFHNCITFDYKSYVIDEIALCGLEGVTIKQLWSYVENRCSTKLHHNLHSRIWSFIVNCEGISFFKSPLPIPLIELHNRFKIINDFGSIKEPEFHLDGPYEYSPIENEYGSCNNYNTRISVSRNSISSISYEDVLEQYGIDSLIMVASLNLRWKALAEHIPMTYLSLLNTQQYCILELVGKGRENGQTTIGKSNLLKICSDSKALFYLRKGLQDLELVKVVSFTQVTGMRGQKCTVLRLKKFHNVNVYPQTGPVWNLVKHLSQQPLMRDTYSNLTKLKITQPGAIKKLRKMTSLFYSQQEEKKTPYLCLDIKNEEETNVDDDSEKIEPLQSQYQIGVGLLRQAYDRVLEAGPNGLTNVELGMLLDVGYYTTRTLCRLLKHSKVAIERFEDKGKQRRLRLIAVAATGKHDKYSEEKKKLMEYVQNEKEKSPKSAKNRISQSEDSDIPLKKIKLEDDALQMKSNENIEEVVTVDGCNNFNASLVKSKRPPTLRQLTFANGVIKATREKLVVTGYQNLNRLVAKETGEPPMDHKSLRNFIQVLVNDKQLKLIKLKWPTSDKNPVYSLLFCAPHVKITDPIVQTKYREISVRACVNNLPKNPICNADSITRPYRQRKLPRYLRLRKLHESLMNMLYFNDVKLECHKPPGFAHLANVLPEITVEFALGLIQDNTPDSVIAYHKFSDHTLALKLCEAPEDLYKQFLYRKVILNLLNNDIKVLSLLGLVQLIDQNDSQIIILKNSLLKCLFYVNRIAKVTDTTGIWPRQNADIEKLERTFHFNTFADVQAYWDAVRLISQNTKIVMKPRTLSRFTPKPTIVDESKLDVNFCERYGNKSGPCGFDSLFFMELGKYWTVAMPNETIAYKETKLKHLKTLKYKKTKKVVTQKKVIPKVAPVSFKKPLNLQSILWSDFEDKIIMLSNAAISILSPNQLVGCKSVRNRVASDILSMKDPAKVIQVCHFRATALDNNERRRYECEHILSELKIRKRLIHKYEGLLPKLKLKHAGSKKGRFLKEARLCTMELMWIMIKLIESKCFARSTPCVALNFEEFQKKYKITTLPPPKNYYTQTLVGKPELNTLKEVIIQILLIYRYKVLAFQNVKEIQAISRQYPENTLQTAVWHLKNCSAVTAKTKKNVIVSLPQNTIPSICRTSFFYHRKFASKLSPSLYTSVYNSIYEPPKDNSNGSSEFNVYICESIVSGVVDVVLKSHATVVKPCDIEIAVDDLVNDSEMNLSFRAGEIKLNIKNNKKNELKKSYDQIFINDALDEIKRNAIIETDSSFLPEDNKDPIVCYIKSKKEKGVLFVDLEKHFDMPSKTLYDKIKQLASKNIIRRVGFNQNLLVHFDHIKPWTVKLSDCNLIPTPFLWLNGTTNYNTFLEFSQAVIDKVFDAPGCSISHLSRLLEYVTSHAVQEICQFLKEQKCFKINVVKSMDVNLFDDEEEPIVSEFNEFESPENIHVFPTKDCLLRYAVVRARISELMQA